ncbi:hypothetical protein BCA33_01740 [Marinobacter sp. AC-23]|nr:hypothetical protein BCA33_01740 [Marinobacter sp. AC-23]
MQPEAVLPAMETLAVFFYGRLAQCDGFTEPGRKPSVQDLVFYRWAPRVPDIAGLDDAIWQNRPQSLVEPILPYLIEVRAKQSLASLCFFPRRMTRIEELTGSIC